MKICPSCKRDRLKVTHCYSAGDRASTRSKVCRGCGARFTEVLILQEGEGRGNGAAAVAKKLREKGHAEEATF